MISYERRFKILYVTKDLFLHVFQAMKNLEFVVFPVLDEIPADVELVRVFESNERNAWGLVLFHPTFPMIPDGWELPAFASCFQKMESFCRRPISETHGREWIPERYEPGEVQID